MTKNSPPPDKVTAYKGFDKNLQCRGFQFEIGKTYAHDGKVKACESGFHAIEGHPLEVFAYYPPGTSRFCMVELGGDMGRHSEDSKVAAQILTVGAEIGISDMVRDAVKFVMDRSRPEGETATGNRGAASSTGNRGAASSTGDQGAASSTGYRGAASSTGYQGAAISTGNRGAASSTGNRGAASSTGDQGAASSTGYQGAASSTGYQGAAISTGYQGAASSTGDQGAAISTGNRGAASSTGDQGAASSTGDQGAASSTGYRGAAISTGYQGAASSTGNRGAASSTGYQGAAMASGWMGRVMGADGNALFSVEREVWDGPIVSIACGIVGQGGIIAGVWYRAIGGKLVKA